MWWRSLLRASILECQVVEPSPPVIVKEMTTTVLTMKNQQVPSAAAVAVAVAVAVVVAVVVAVAVAVAVAVVVVVVATYLPKAVALRLKRASGFPNI